VPPLPERFAHNRIRWATARAAGRLNQRDPKLRQIDPVLNKRIDNFVDQLIDSRGRPGLRCIPQRAVAVGLRADADTSEA